MKKTLEELKQLWEEFGNVPVDNNDAIETVFLDFPEGTDRFEIWHWFDEQCPNGVAKDLLFYC